jgi:hypothetical protein
VLSGDDGAVPSQYRRLILAQGVNQPGEFQLPEPLLGPILERPILVLGLNPFHRAGADRPRLGCPFDDYVRYFEFMFAPDQRNEAGRIVKPELDGSLRAIAHFAEVEDALAPALGPRALGRVAVYADAIAWKSKRPPRLDTELKAAMKDRIAAIIDGLKPRAVVTFGRSVSRRIAEWSPDPPEAQIRTVGRWTGPIITSWHPGAWDRFTPAYKARLGEALRQVDPGLTLPRGGARSGG